MKRFRQWCTTALHVVKTALHSTYRSVVLTHRFKQMEADIRALCTYFSVDPITTLAWQYLHTAYNPLVGISKEEEDYENVFIRMSDRDERLWGLFCCMYRYGDIPAPAVRDALKTRDLTPLLTCLGGVSHYGLYNYIQTTVPVK